MSCQRQGCECYAVPASVAREAHAHGSVLVHDRLHCKPYPCGRPLEAAPAWENLAACCEHLNSNGELIWGAAYLWHHVLV